MMYEHNGKLFVRTAGGSFVEVTLTVTGENVYKVKVVETSKPLASRPHGATPVTPDEIIRRYNLQEGNRYPKPVAPVQKQLHKVPTGQHPVQSNVRK